MRFSLITFACLASSALAQTCNQVSLLSCVAAPVSTLCTTKSADWGCVCSQLSAQSSCYPQFCPTSTLDDTVQSVMNANCGGSHAATTTGKGTAATATATTTGTGVAAKTGAAAHLAVPIVAGHLGAIIGGAFLGL